MVTIFLKFNSEEHLTYILNKHNDKESDWMEIIKDQTEGKMGGPGSRSCEEDSCPKYERDGQEQEKWITVMTEVKRHLS